MPNEHVATGGSAPTAPRHLPTQAATGPSARAWRVIVVDDEEHLCEMVADYLQAGGFAVRTAPSGERLDALLAEEDADLLLLDVNMPGEDGLSIVRRIRATHRLPIIFLTAADDVTDRIVGLEIGADDYMTKPFDLRELKARVRARLRGHAPRDEAAAAAPKPGRAALVPFGTKHLDLDARCLVAADGRSEPLTAMEFELIAVFLRNPDRVLTRDHLLDLVHKRDNDPFDRSIDVRMTRIRKKIEPDPAKPQTLKTVRGVGYMYTPTRRGP